VAEDDSPINSGKNNYSDDENGETIEKLNKKSSGKKVKDEPVTTKS